jgi:hypothetical protein
MKPHQKAWYLLEKMNNQPIDFETWEKASDYAKYDLRRKVNIVIDEILTCYPPEGPKDSFEMEKHLYWVEVKKQLENL